MLDHSLEYTGGSLKIAPSTSSPERTAECILDGWYPSNIVNNTRSNSGFKEAVIANVLQKYNPTNHQVLEHMCKAIQTRTDDDPTLPVFLEYLASIAYALGETKLAAKAIMRQPASTVSPFIWSVASALKKQMPSDFYKALLIDEGVKAQSQLLSI